KTDSVCRCYTPDEREGDVPCFFNCHVLCRTHDFTQGMAFNELHGGEGYVAISSWAHALVVDVDHVRVIDPGSILSFCFACFEHRWVFRHTWARQFARASATEPGIGGARGGGRAGVSRPLCNGVTVVGRGANGRGACGCTHARYATRSARLTGRRFHIS